MDAWGTVARARRAIAAALRAVERAAQAFDSYHHQVIAGALEAWLDEVRAAAGELGVDPEAAELAGAEADELETMRAALDEDRRARSAACAALEDVLARLQIDEETLAGAARYVEAMKHRPPSPALAAGEQEERP